ncbi:MAG: choice-of-anchor Q domain-containing protein [Bacteroidota bacterium]
MNRLVYLIVVVSFLFTSCKKDSYITSPGANLQAGVDTLRFDTVFTSVGSITQSLILSNPNSGKLLLGKLKLGGGANSPFKINVNGTPGIEFSNIEMNANDSIYVFVRVTVDPNQATNPFVLLDSIEINFNGKTSKVYLQAYGQNARFINHQKITTNTTWNNSLPYVIQNDFEVSTGATLTIEKGTKVYVNARAAFVINGSLQVNGGKDAIDHVVFKSDRLDAAYKDLPGSWPGIVFTEKSRNNELTFADIFNAYQALVVLGGFNQIPARLQLRQCQISNAYDIGVYGLNASISAVNCLISQCGNDGEAGIGGSNVLLSGGGKYDFENCTIATYANLYQNHKQPVCFISNSAGGISSGLSANFSNCIIYGQGGNAENELQVQKASNDLVVFSNCLYMLKNDPAGVVFTDCLKNSDPLFDSISTGRQQFNFRLKEGSPAIDAGRNTAVLIDLDGNSRISGTKTDMGCYEKQ